MSPDDPLAGPERPLRPRREPDAATYQDRALLSLERLENLQAQESSDDFEQWRAEVLAALRELAIATADETQTIEQPESFVSDVARTQPRLRTKARGLRLRYHQLLEELESLYDELAEHRGAANELAEFLHRLSWIAGAVREQVARETRLIYDAYFEAFDAELAPEDESS